MKFIRINLFKIVIIVLLQVISTTYGVSQVGINDNNASPDASAMLDVKSTDKGMLIPRMTTAQRDAISSTATGLMIYNTSTNKFNYYNGTAWTVIGEDNLGDHTATSNILLNNNWLTNNGSNEGLKISNFGAITNISSSARPLLIQHNTLGNGTYLEVNNAAGTRALFGVDGNGVSGGDTTDVVLANWSNGGLNFFTNATKRAGFSKYGMFTINDTLQIFDGSQGVGKVLTSDANGLATWATPAAGGSDNLGDHTTTQNIQLGSNWISADGDNEGILISNTGQVGIGKVNAVNHLFQVANNISFYNDITTPSTTVTASNHHNQFIPSNIVDNDNNLTAWISTNSPAWIKFDLGSPQTVSHYSIQSLSNNLTFYSDIYFSDWTFEGSNDSMSWTVLDTKSSFTFTTHIDTFALASPATYQYYRLNGLQNNFSFLQLIEIELFNAVATSTNILTISDAGAIKFNNAYTFPSEDGSANQSLRTDGSGNLFWNSTTPFNLITDADNDTKIQVEKTANDDIIRFDINGVEKMTLKTTHSINAPLVIGFPNNYGNVLLGENTGSSMSFSNSNSLLARFNTYIGAAAGQSDQNGYNNTYLGYQAGQNVVNGIGNIYIGYQAGQNQVGSNHLFIHNSNTATPLIYGDFASSLLRVNGTLNINNAYTLPTADGVAGAVLKTNGSGDVSWVNSTDIQNFDVTQLTGDVLELSLSQDGLATHQINLSGVDNQQLDVLHLIGDNLQVSLQNDGIATHSLNLATIDNQKTDVFQLNGNNLEFSLENDGIATQSLNLGAIDNQETDVFQLNGNHIELSLENDGVATKSIDLSYQISSKTTPLFLESTSTGNSTLIELKNGTGSGAYFGVGGAGTGTGGTTSDDIVIGNRGSGNMEFRLGVGNGMYLSSNGLGIKMFSFPTMALSVAGEAWKATSGSWITSSDRRLKKNIKPLSSEKMLEKLLAIQGVTYEWNDVTGRPRPEGIQYGFIAQNVQEVFPTLISEDNYGYLMMPYDTYDAMMVEGLRALNNKIENQQQVIQQQNEKIQALESQTSKINQLESLLQQLQQQVKANTNQSQTSSK